MDVVMRRIAFSVLGVGLIVLGLWAWQWAPDAALDWTPEQPRQMLWAVRGGAVAAFAAAQALLLASVLAPYAARTRFDRAVGFAMTLISVVAGLGAIAYGWMAQQG